MIPSPLAIAPLFASLLQYETSRGFYPLPSMHRFTSSNTWLT